METLSKWEAPERSLPILERFLYIKLVKLSDYLVDY